GLDDQIALLPNRKARRTNWQGRDDLSGTLDQVSDDAPVLLMAHEPGIIRKIPDRVSLTLSGHTHGGQINCFGYKPVSGTVLGRNQNYGHIVYADGTRLTNHLGLAADPKHLIISGGLGCSIIPVRFGVPPEITLVHLGETAPTA
ncbi:MAG: metallophosphoesterase, partial [Roseibium sp.]|nr:metallophosphoesterase [Roseibium sp.]